MSRTNFNAFLYYLGIPFMIEGFQLSGEVGLGICILSYISIDAAQTFDLTAPQQKAAYFLNNFYIKLSGIDFKLPSWEMQTLNSLAKG